MKYEIIILISFFLKNIFTIVLSKINYVENEILSSILFFEP